MRPTPPVQADDVRDASHFVEFLMKFGLNKTAEIFHREWGAVMHATSSSASPAQNPDVDEGRPPASLQASPPSLGQQLRDLAKEMESDSVDAAPESPIVTVFKNTHNANNNGASVHKDPTGVANAAVVNDVDPSPVSKAPKTPGQTNTQAGVLAAVKECQEWTGDDDLGIITAKGDTDELYDIAETDPMAPCFPNGGAITAEEHCRVVGTEPEYERCFPTAKQMGATGSQLESFDLRVIYEAGRTGFEEEKEFPIVAGSIIAGRYQVSEYLGSAAFSRAIQCIDLKHGHQVCIKIIRNSKDFLDQSLDEIKLLQYINSGEDPDAVHILQLYDYFYFKEHMFLVCELLRDNLYEFSKFNRENEPDFYFTLPRLQRIAKQVTTALNYIHSLGLMHCDLKPENILVRSYSRCEIKVIDFGSSCYTTDHLSSYIQSRCYRAPEVIIGSKYDGKIDVWSMGAILPELATGHVLFHNDSVASMLARISAVCGPFPKKLLLTGRHTHRFFNKHGVVFEYLKDTNELLHYYPKRTTLAARCGYSDPDYLDFVAQCLRINPADRPSAAELLKHPFLSKDYEGMNDPPPGFHPPAARTDGEE